MGTQGASSLLQAIQSPISPPPTALEKDGKTSLCPGQSSLPSTLTESPLRDIKINSEIVSRCYVQDRQTEGTKLKLHTKLNLIFDKGGKSLGNN